MADDLGYGDLGCYGQERIQTPNIDRLADEGVRFTQAYSGATVCAPSRCCLMTGVHGGHARVRDNVPHGVFLQPDDITIANVLKGAGYQTGAIGKWSLGNPGSWGVANWQGFDYFYGHLNQDQAHFYYPHYLWEDNKVVLLDGNRGGKQGEYTQDLFTEKALDFIDTNKQRPFFLYLPFTIPHWSDYDMSSDDSQLVPTDAPYTDEDWPQVEKNYAAMVTHMDRDVGRIMNRLKEYGLDSNTLVVFTSDNGPSAEGLHDPSYFRSGGTLRGCKRDLYEGGIRIPFIVRWPGQAPAGATSDQVFAFWDMLPTFAEAAGLPPTGLGDGVSMLPEFRGEAPATQHDYLYWDYGHIRGNFQQAIRTEQWKGVRYGLQGAVELYNLDEDIGEATDVSAIHPDVVTRIEGMMAEAFVEAPDYPIKPPS
jgi:arylsulfatase A-like enzyme